MEPLISIIVPIYNVKDYIDRCVNSIIDQTYKNLEIILVDDGSIDGSSVICEKWKVSDSRIQTIHKKNGGLSDARNSGIEAAKGEYISFIDGDDEIDSKMIAKLYHAIITNQSEVAMCRMEKIEKNRKFVTREFPDSNNKEILLSGTDAIRLLLLDKIDCSACLKLYHRSIFDSLRFPYGKTNEDFAIMYKVFHNVDTVAYISDILYHYYYRENSITSSEFSEKQFDKLENCYDMLAYIQEYEQDVIHEARHYMLRQSLYLLKTLIEKKIIYQYIARFDELRNNIKRNSVEIIFSKWLSLKEKGMYLCVAFFPFFYEHIHN